MIERETDAGTIASMRLAALRRPWVVVIALAVVGITGAIVVNATARRIHAKDRAAIETFRRESIPDVEQAIAVHRALAARVRSNNVRASDLLGYRAKLERSRRELEAVHLARVLVPSAQGFLSGIGFTLSALSYIERGIQDGDTTLSRKDHSEFEAAWTIASEHFANGDQRFDALLCRARSKFCAG